MTTDARTKALDQIERAERRYQLAFWAACALEAAVLAVLLFSADMSNRTHVLLLAGFVGSYSIIVLAIAALGAHVTRVNARLLLAIDLIAVK